MDLVVQYLALRRAVGYLGSGLPFVLSIGAAFLFGTGLQSSLSAYYHTDVGDIFVGVLCALGVFFWAYKGYSNETVPDDWIGNVAGVCAIGTALFPTAASGGLAEAGTAAAKAHAAFAGALFLTLAHLSYFRFTKTHPGASRTQLKNQRDRIYRTAGVVIVASVALIATLWATREWGWVSVETLDRIEAWKPVFWLESIAVVSFGAAWAVKGQALLPDRDGEREIGKVRRDSGLSGG